MNIEILDKVIREAMSGEVGEAAQLAMNSPEALQRLSSTAVEVLGFTSLDVDYTPIHAILCQAILIGYKAAQVERETEQLGQLYEREV